MYRPRIIPVLLLKNSGLVKSVFFKNFNYIGDPINAVKIFNDLRADELIFLDINVTGKNKKINFEKRVSFTRLFALSFCSCAIMAFYNSFDIYSIVLRYTNQNYSVDLGTSGRLIYKFIIFPIPSIVFILYLKFCKKTFLRTFVLLSLFLIFNSCSKRLFKK